MAPGCTIIRRRPEAPRAAAPAGACRRFTTGAGHENPRGLPGDSMELDEDLKARDRILFLLKTRGPQTARDLASELEVTAIAVRQHLQGLEGKGLVAHSLKKGRVGRPAHVWRLTGAAQRRFPDNHGDLTVGLLGTVRQVFGAEGLQRLLAAWARRESIRCQAKLGPCCDDVTERVALLVKMRREQGYMAEWSRQADGSFEIVENHCPIAAAACECDDLCRGELDVFSAILGDGVSVVREEHIASGDRRCLYRVAERHDGRN